MRVCRTTGPAAVWTVSPSTGQGSPGTEAAATCAMPRRAPPRRAAVGPAEPSCVSLLPGVEPPLDRGARARVGLVGCARSIGSERPGLRARRDPREGRGVHQQEAAARRLRRRRPHPGQHRDLHGRRSGSPSATRVLARAFPRCSSCSTTTAPSASAWSSAASGSRYRGRSIAPSTLITPRVTLGAGSRPRARRRAAEAARRDGRRAAQRRRPGERREGTRATHGLPSYREAGGVSLGASHGHVQTTPPGGPPPPQRPFRLQAVRGPAAGARCAPVASGLMAMVHRATLRGRGRGREADRHQAHGAGRRLHADPPVPASARRSTRRTARPSLPRSTWTIASLCPAKNVSKPRATGRPRHRGLQFLQARRVELDVARCAPPSANVRAGRSSRAPPPSPSSSSRTRSAWIRTTGPSNASSRSWPWRSASSRSTRRTRSSSCTSTRSTSRNGVYGIGTAAEFYFGKPAAKLTLTEGATLAGIIQAPNFYDPIAHPVKARVRRNDVLNAMIGSRLPDDVEGRAGQDAAARAGQGRRQVPAAAEPLLRDVHDPPDPDQSER